MKCNVRNAVLIALGVLVLLAIIFLIVFFVVIKPNMNKSQTTPLPTAEETPSNGTAEAKPSNDTSSSQTSNTSNETKTSNTTTKHSHYLALNQNHDDETDDSDG